MNRRKSTATKSPASPDSKSSPFNYTSLGIMGGIFVLGIGIGIAFTTVASSGTANIVNREEIDARAPNPELCAQYGASAMVTDTRIYVTLNPFNVYVSQPIMRPGCVLRTNNWAILEQRKLISSQQVIDCKNRMNTFGFTGNLESSPDIRCIYQNDAAGNTFLNQPGSAAPPPEAEKF